MLFGKTNRLNFVITGIFVAGVLFSLCFNFDNVFAYTASITTSSSVSLNVAPGGDGSSIYEESINVQSDCRSGYNLAVATPNGSDLYANGDNTNNATFTAVDGVSALNSSNNNNKWGYTLISGASSSTVFSPLSENASVLKTSAQTASANDINDTFSIYYGAKVDGSVAIGSYRMANNGAIVYYLTMDTICTQYAVSFNANGGTGDINNQILQIGEPTKLTSADAFTAPAGASYTDANNNTINGQADKIWVFWGWNTSVDGTGDWYKDKEEVVNLATAGNTAVLYAQWKQATLADLVVGTQVGTEKVIDHNLIQDMRPGVCWNSENTDAADAPAATLLDYRGKVTTGENPEAPEQYNVSKLSDGLCWTTTNLNLGRDDMGGPNGNGTITLTADDTDLGDNTTFVLPASTTTSSTATTARIRTTNNSGTRDNGVYYSWMAATANSSSSITRPTTSICPKNWDLPTEKQYNNLASKSNYDSTNQTTDAPSTFLINGGFTNGASFYQTGYSHLWTSVSSTASAYGARITNSGILTSLTTGTTYGGNKYYEKNVRCVAGQGSVTVNYNGNTNDGGATASQENVEINSTNTASNGFTKSGWGFVNWNTKADGSGLSIAAGGAISSLNPKLGSTITLYAQWVPQYTITYVNNCMTYVGNSDACTQTVSNSTSEQKINLDANGDGSGTLASYNNENTWSITGWKIVGWSTVADNSSGINPEYKSSSSYAVTGQSAGDGITLYAHWKRIYSVQYDGNGASNTNGMGTTNATTGVKSVRFTNVSEGDTITLLASNFKRAGYGFAGWSTNPNATVSSGDTIYGPMAVINAPAYPTNGTSIITMYAVWVPAEKNGNNNPIYFQDWNGCSGLTPASYNSSTEEITAGSIIALTDKRDNQVYAVAKLADEKCWMIENLRLNAEGTLGNNINDSSVTNQSLAQGYGGATGTFGNFVGLADSESISGASTTANSIYKSTANPPVDTYDPLNGTLEDIGTSNNPANRFPRYNNNNTQNSIDSTTFTRNYSNASSPSDSGTYARTYLYSYGNNYTWTAAMANTNHYVGITSTDSAGKTSEAVGTSLCPTGWHLPSSSNSAKEFGALSLGYGGTGDNQSGTANAGNIMSRRLRAFPNNFLFSYNRGVDGRYWSRTSWNSTNAYDLMITNVTWSPAEHYAKNAGFNVRCLFGS